MVAARIKVGSAGAPIAPARRGVERQAEPSEEQRAETLWCEGSFGRRRDQGKVSPAAAAPLGVKHPLLVVCEAG